MNSYIYEFIYIYGFTYSLIRFLYIISNPSNTLMKLAKGSKQRIIRFEKEAHRHLQSSSLSSKLTIRDDVVRECFYICNQNYDQRVHFHCVAISDNDWMLWNFYHKQQDVTDISNQVQNFHDVHHVQVKILAEQVFLRCDCLLYER